MSDKLKKQIAPEALATALEHIGQTMEAMNKTVGEIRDYLEQPYLESQLELTQQEVDEMEWPEEENPSRLLH
jgi:hypothetical protein